MRHRVAALIIGVAMTAQPLVASASPLCHRAPAHHVCCCPTSSGTPCTMACGDHAAPDALSAPAARSLPSSHPVLAVAPDAAIAIPVSRPARTSTWRAHAPPTRLYLLACILRL